MMRTSVILVARDDQALALGRILRGRFAAHRCDPSESAGQVLARHRRIGVAVIDAGGGVAPSLARLADLQAERPDLRCVLLASPTDLHAMLEGAAGARVIPAPWREDALMAAVNAAASEAECLRAMRLATALAERRLARLRKLEAPSGLSIRSAHMLAEANVRLRQSTLGLARLVSIMAEGGDPDLSSRRERVARTAVALARRLGWPSSEIEDVRMAALLTDVGRAWTLGEAGAFDLDGALAERSAQVLAPLPFSRQVIAAVRHHHERWDGLGAPGGLRGAQIPRLARLIALADAFVRLVDEGDGHSESTDAGAAQDLRQEAGRAHDPDMVEALVGMMGESDESHALPELELVGGLA